MFTYWWALFGTLKHHVLCTNRYDLRNRLEDKNQFGLKPILPRRRTQEEDDLEEMLDKDRYFSLGIDVLEHQLLEGRAFYLFKSDYIH